MIYTYKKEGELTQWKVRVQIPNGISKYGRGELCTSFVEGEFDKADELDKILTSWVENGKEDCISAYCLKFKKRSKVGGGNYRLQYAKEVEAVFGDTAVKPEKKAEVTPPSQQVLQERIDALERELAAAKAKLERQLPDDKEMAATLQGKGWRVKPPRKHFGIRIQFYEK